MLKSLFFNPFFSWSHHAVAIDEEVADQTNLGFQVKKW